MINLISAFLLGFIVAMGLTFNSWNYYDHVAACLAQSQATIDQAFKAASPEKFDELKESVDPRAAQNRTREIHDILKDMAWPTWWCRQHINASGPTRETPL